MIESLLLRNFQNHKRFFVELSPHVTTFVGNTAAGKSAILRALKWVMLNQPTGDDFIGNWKKAPYALCKLLLDGHTIIRKRSTEGSNIYRVDGKILRAFGVGVPQVVSDICNVGALNFQSQIEPPLWFTESAPEVSRRLNSIINLSSIDAALEEASKQVRKTKAAVVVSEERLNQFRTERNSTLWAIEFDTDVQYLETIHEKIVRIDARASRIASAASGISEAALAHQNAAQIILDAGNAISTITAYQSIARTVVSLGSRLDQIERSRTLATLPAPSIVRLERLRRKALDTGERCRKIDSLQFAGGQLQWEVNDASKQIAQIKKQLASDKTKRCPTCGQMIRPTPSESSQRTGTSPMTHPSVDPKVVRRGMTSKHG